MIELFYSETPNGRKISIMLEEIKFDYKITEIDLSKGDQFKTNFRKFLLIWPVLGSDFRFWGPFRSVWLGFDARFEFRTSRSAVWHGQTPKIRDVRKNRHF